MVTLKPRDFKGIRLRRRLALAETGDKTPVTKCIVVLSVFIFFQVFLGLF
jgi:hypothetical protein